MAAAIAPVAQTYSVRVCSASARKGILVLLLAQLLGLFKQVSPASAHSSVGKLEGEELQRALRSLEGLCVDNLLSQEWWTYRWCFGKDAQQIHLDRISGEVAQSFSLGAHVPEESSLDHHILRDSSQSCNHRRKSEELHLSRYTEVSLECCEDEINDTKRFGRLTKYQRHSDEGSLIHNLDVVASAGNTHTYIAKVTEPVPCSYYITICSSLVCADHSPRFTTVPSTSGDSVAIRSSSLKEATPHSRLSSSSGTKPTSLSHSSPVHRLPTREEQLQMRERVRSMFHHAYDSYMTYAFPEAELKPISCEGGRFDLVKIPMVTLIDSLDTLVVMGNYTEFRAAVELVTFHLGKNQFNFDANVSVFETTIRVLGGLLSAHLMAIDPQLSIYSDDEKYAGQLLNLSVDLGNRLLPAFSTKTGIPYGTVNLRHGVPRGETKIASTAGAGSLLMEFEALSMLSGDEKFGAVALLATEALFDRRSSIGLLGKHINIETGQWHELLSGIGSNSDSFYEYLLKAYLLSHRKQLFGMFTETYNAIKRFVMADEYWFTEVDMYSGKLQRKRLENLDAFWPGLEASLGFHDRGASQLNAMYGVWADLGFLPEEIDYHQWQLGKKVMNAYYPLRPELIESTYHQYRATGDRSWLLAGQMFLESIEEHTRVECGYATVADLKNMKLHDSMASFFLSETCKYMYLLFDEDNFINYRPYIFSTEAHPFDPLQLHKHDQRVKKSAALLWESEGYDEESLWRLEVSQGPRNSKNRFDSILEKSPAFDGKGISHHASDLLHVKRFTGGRRQRERTKKRRNNSPLIAKQRGALHSVENTEENKATDLSTLFLPLQCKRNIWWDQSASYNSRHLDEPIRLLREENKSKDLKLTAAARAAAALQIAVEKGSSRNKQEFMIAPRQAQAVAMAVAASDHPGFQWVDGKIQSKCNVADEPLHSSQATATTQAAKPATDKEDPGLLKTVEVNMSGIGDFLVKVYADGFVVHNTLEQNTIEISNVGKSQLFVRDISPSQGARTVVGNISAFSVLTCAVQTRRQLPLVKTEQSPTPMPSASYLLQGLSLVGFGGDYSSPDSGSAGSNSGASNDLYNDLLDLDQGSSAIWECACSTANFGGKKSVDKFLPLRLPSKHNSQMCKSVSEELEAEASAAGDAMKKRWWQWSLQFNQQFSNADDGGNQLLAREQQLRERFQGNVLLVDRGGCLFEDKALAAQTMGAQAVIVRNHEDHLFLMAGRNDVAGAPSEGQNSISSTKKKRKKRKEKVKAKSEQKAIPLIQAIPGENFNGKGDRAFDGSSPLSERRTDKKFSEEASDIEEEEDVLIIPTVMVTQSDGEELLQQLNSAASAQNRDYSFSANDADVRILLDEQSMYFTNEFFGDFQYPKLWMHQNVIYLIGRGSWGCFLTSNSGEAWQLFLMTAVDMMSNQLIPALTLNALPREVLGLPSNSKKHIGEEHNTKNHVENQVDDVGPTDYIPKVLPISVPSTIVSHPVELYFHLIHRKCPHVVEIDLKTGQYLLRK